MFYRSVRLLFLSIFLTSAVIQSWAQVCPDTEPWITGPAVVCESASNVVGYSTPDVTGHYYSWTVQRISAGSGGWAVIGPSNLPQFNIRWTDVGIFRITLQEGISGNSCTPKQTTLDITSQPFLAAYYYYTFDPLYGCYYNIVSFTGDVSLHTDPSITYLWDFGDGSANETIPNPIHTFPTTPGVTYSVTLTIQDSQGRQDQIIDYVYVDPDKYKPDPQFTATPIGCLYDGTLFDASASRATHAITSETIIHFKWVWGDGDSIVLPGNQPITNHIYTNPNTYNVTLTVTNSKGCFESLTLPVTVAPTVPTADFTISPACLNEITYFDGHNSVTPIGTITDLIWNFGDGSPVDTTHDVNQIVQHTYLSLGPFPPATLKVINSMGCESQVVSQPVQIFRAPRAGFEHGNACLGTPVVFTNTSQREGGSDLVSYLWTFGDGNTSAEESPNYMYTGTGTFHVTMRVTNADNCFDTWEDDIIVYPNPDVDFTAAIGTTPYEVIFQEILNPLQHVGNNLQWDFGDGQAAQGPNPTHIYPGPGTFVVTLVGTDMLTGCPTTVQHSVTVGATPNAFFTAEPQIQCQGVPINFIPAIPPGGLITTEDWYYNDGSLPNPEHFDWPNTPAFPVHIFQNPGIYLVERYVNKGTALEAYWSLFVTIDPQPGAQFTWFSDAAFTHQGMACANQPVYFQDASYSNSTPPGVIYLWEWNFGDPASGPNNISNQQNPIHTFSTAGTTYGVRLIVTDNLNDCKDTISHNVIVNPVIPVDFSFGNNVCVDKLVVFTTDTVILPTASFTWLWDFGDGTTSTQPGTVSHLYPYVGTFNVSLTLTDQWGCTNTKVHTVTTIPVPIANFTFTSPTCDGEAIAFTDQSVVPAPYPDIIVGWLWDFGDGVGTSTQQNPTYIYPVFNPGGYDVTLMVTTNQGCTATKMYHVQPIPRPAADFEVQPLTPSCVNQPVQFQDLTQLNGGGILTFWNWNFGDPGSGSNNISYAQNPVHTFSQASPPPYDVTLIVTNANGCKDTIVKQIFISALPVAAFTASESCMGNNTTFTDNSTTPAGTTIVSYYWDFGDGGNSTQQNPQHPYANYGNYNVTLTITNSNQCIHDTMIQVTVFANPIADFIFTPSSCMGSPVSYTDLSTIPGTFSGYINQWIWNFDDGTIDTINYPANPNVTHTFAGTATTHNVRLTVNTTKGCTHYIVKTVTSIPSPLANFAYSTTTCANQPVQFTDLSQTNGGGSIQTWDWNFGDPLSGGNNTSTLQNPIHSFTAPGPFTVQLVVTSINGCKDTLQSQIIIDSLPIADFTNTSPCEGNTMTFTSTSTPNASTIISYNWDFGDGGSSLLPNPQHVYANYGNFLVTLTVVNSNGCIHDTTKQVTVNPKPVAEFSYSQAACIGNPVDYVDQSYVPSGFSGYIDTWTWNFDDGTGDFTITFPNNPNISHTFAGTATTHLVRLTVTTTTGCTSYIEKTVTSIPSPIANFTTSAITCASQEVQFTDLSQTNGGGSIVLWEWNFGDPGSGANNASTLQNPLHTFAQASPPPYDVQLVVTNVSGCKDTLTLQITINARPTAQFSASKECLTSATVFTDESTPPTGASIVSHYWTFGDGANSTLQNPTHTYANAGIYNVTLLVTTNQGCTKDTTMQVEVYGKPLPSFTYSSPTCSTDSVHFTDLSTTPHGSIHKWVWDFGDGSALVTKIFPESPNVIHKFPSGGVFNVKLTITTTDSCTAFKILPVTVQFAPTANFEFEAGPCEDIPLQFTDLSQANGGGTIVAWEWNFGDPGSGVNNTSTAQNPSHAFTAGSPPPFTVLLLVTNSAGCTDTISKQVTVNPAPLAQFTADTACVASPTQFTDESTTPTGTIVAWEWNFGDPGSGSQNTSTAQNPTHIYNSPGTYSVTLVVTNSNNCTNDTVMQISVNPKPQAMFEYTASCVGDSTQFTDLSIAPGSQIMAWFWDFDDGGNSTIQNPKHVFATSGTFMVKLVVTNLANCTDSVTIPVVARPKPTAAFTYVNFFCPKGQVNFQDQSHGNGSAIVEHYWIFEPGYTSTLVNPQYTFPVTDTTYLVTLIVTDTYGCKDTIINSVFVKPGFEFTFNNDTVCHGYHTQFHAINEALGDSLYSLVWNFGDPNSGSNNISYLYNPTHVFTQPGLYVVMLKAWNSDNCVDSVFHDIQVYAPPATGFAYNSQPCDSTIYFNDTTNNPGTGTIASWEWRFGDGSPPVVIIAPGPGDTSHLYMNPGIYPVTLIITNTRGCIDSITTNVERFPCIKASFDYNDTLLCATYLISFSDSSLPISRINEWHWIWGDGTDTTYINHSSPITHTYANAGTFIVTLAVRATVNGTDIIDSITRQVTIKPTPESYFSNIASCLKQPTVFLDTSNTYGEPVTQWYWNFGEPGSGVKDTSTFKNPSHTYAVKGIYDVKMVVMNRFGCKDSITKSTRIYGLPIAHYDNTIACTGDPTYFEDKSSLSDTLIGFWKWNFGDTLFTKDTSTLQNPEHRYRYAGSYTVRMIVKDFFGCLDTIDSTVTVNITPTSAFTVSDNFNGKQGNVKLNNSSEGASGYNWYFGNGKTSDEENPIVTYTEDGTYIIKLISLNEFGCSDTTYFEYKLLFKGLYVPNAFSPTNTNLAVRLFKPVGTNLKQYHVTVFDTWGHLLWESTKLNTQGEPDEGWDGTYNGKIMPQGTYMWKIQALFVDDSPWNGGDIGKGEYSTIGTVSLIR